MFQIGQSGNGGGLHAFGRYCFSARSEDIDRWSECDFPPTGAVQGMSPRDRKPKKVCASLSSRMGSTNRLHLGWFEETQTVKEDATLVRGHVLE